MTTHDTLNKALATVQKQIDQIIEQYATKGPAIISPATDPDHGPLIQAITARDLLRREQSQRPGPG